MRLAAYVFATTLATLTLAAPASAFTLGVGDGAQYPAAPSAALGATTYRIVIDPDLPLESYTPRILAHRAVGQEPQLVIGGTGTLAHASSRGLVAAAVAAAKRWPSAYSISVVNEPDLSGMAVCEYARTYVQAYRSLHSLGVRRITFGEWSPLNSLPWHKATLTRCGKASAYLRSHALRIAWHAYNDTMGYGREFRAIGRTLHTPSPSLLITEAGAVLRAGRGSMDALQADTAGMRYWHAVLRAVKRDRIDQVVAWDIHSPQSGAWDSGLIDGAGRPRPAFNLIAAR